MAEIKFKVWFNVNHSFNTIFWIPDNDFNNVIFLQRPFISCLEKFYMLDLGDQKKPRVNQIGMRRPNFESDQPVQNWQNNVRTVCSLVKHRTPYSFGRNKQYKLTLFIRKMIHIMKYRTFYKLNKLIFNDSIFFWTSVS